MHEIKELTEKRKARSNSSMLSIVRELNQKWNAFCRLDKKGRFKRNGFIELLKHRVTQVHPFMAKKILTKLDGMI